MGIANYKLPISNFHSVCFLSPARYLYATAIVLPFRQHMFVVSFPQVGDLRLWRLLPFRQKWAGESKTSTVMDISVFEDVFGLKSRIFITAEFILRHESSSSETCLKGSTFPPTVLNICLWICWS